MSKGKLIEMSLDRNSWQFTLEFNLKLVLILALIIMVFCIIIKLYRSKLKSKLVKIDIVPVELSYEIGGVSTKYEIVRNYINIEIGILPRKGPETLCKTNVKIACQDFP